MDRELLTHVKAYALSKQRGLPFPPASEDVICEAERTIGFMFEPFLRHCYLEIGNGGFGPGYGAIGVDGGATSDYGTLIDTYRLLKNDQESQGQCWIETLLPFNDFGCNTFACVSCSSSPVIYLFEGFRLWKQDYDIKAFFQMWIEGKDLLSIGSEVIEKVIRNPVSGNKVRAKGQKRHHSD